ncbi:MAG TPA: acyl-CoA dehydrogenase family protein [Ignavibacteria bacterium]|nr:acyl-CoA dehydrogenase family protein [Ignavibacteria bacterium]
MPNFFTDNSDLVFHFNNLDYRRIVEIAEDNFEQAKEFNYAPVNYEDAMENYRKVLEMTGDLTGNYIAPRAADVDIEGAQYSDGKVDYAKGTQQNLKELTMADLMGMVLPRKYGGLNFPLTIYMMATEMVARADASLMNIFGLQDIAEMIDKYGTDEQKQKYIPGFCTGEYTGAMALTEPDAGSDLQAVKLQAYQDEKGKWFLRGVKRFITNGNAQVHLVLARSEPGTKDGRGLSMFACFTDKTVRVRRIEHKLGIHGSPTCELQFNDTPAELVGQRKFGLIKYVFDLMFRARMGVSAQALGISQAAYEEALMYAKDRVQFGKAIYNIPPVANMLIDMRVMVEYNRSLLYATGVFVDMKEKTVLLIDKYKKEGKSVTDLNNDLKYYTKISNLLTPMTKYWLTECANKITYDSMQIHGGTGYMKEFRVERLARDARITNIYEGTSQMQIVAAISGVINDILKDLFDKKEKKNYTGGLSRLASYLKEIRIIFYDCLKYVMDKKDNEFQDVAAKDLVELYSYLFIGYLLLDEAEIEPRKKFIASRYIINSLANAKKNTDTIKNELFTDILHADEILI